MVDGEPDREWKILKLRHKAIAFEKEDGIKYYYTADEDYPYAN